MVDAIADIIGSVDGVPRNLSSGKKKDLKSTSYGDKRARAPRRVPPSTR
jgi:hypothetical protein